jgi:orotate phosphoribosyltransferase
MSSIPRLAPSRPFGNSEMPSVDDPDGMSHDAGAMIDLESRRTELLKLLQAKSVFHGDFILSSGARSPYYVDCKLTTLDAQGATLVGELMHRLIRQQAAARDVRVDAVGGLTMGADPIALAVAIRSLAAGDRPPLQAFSVRKTPKGHGQGKRIEGNFQPGQTVVVIDDVVTRGESTLAAIEAVAQEGGRVAFVAALVDRQEGGRERIEALGHPMVALFSRAELLQADR